MGELYVTMWGLSEEQVLTETWAITMAAYGIARKVNTTAAMPRWRDRRIVNEESKVIGAGK